MTTTVYTSGTHSGTVSSGDEVDLLGAAVGLGLVVQSGGVVSAFGGGTTSGSMIGGSEVVGTGGTDSGSTVGSGGTETVLSGGTASGIQVVAGGTSLVSGGIVGGTILTGSTQVRSGAAVEIQGRQIVSGGTVSGTTIYDGGYQEVDGGAVSGTVLSGGMHVAGGFVVEVVGEQVVSGGTVSGTTVDNGGYQEVDGGTVGGAVVNSGGFEVISGGTVSAAILNNGGLEEIYGGVVDGTTISTGGEQVVSDGTADGTIIDGGVQNVLAGTVSGTVVGFNTPQIFSEGEQEVGGGTVNGTIIGFGGSQLVSGGVVSGTIVSGGSQEVKGGAVVGTTISFGSQDVVGGSADATILGNEGSEAIYGGMVSGVTIGSGASQYVLGGVADDVTIGADGDQYISGGMVSGTIIGSSGMQFISGAATVIDTTVNSGGLQIDFHGTAQITGIVEAGGTMELFGPETANGMTFSGGTEVLFEAAVSGTVLSEDGLANLVVAADASETGLVVTRGTQETVSSRGQSVSATISGNEVVAFDGKAISSLIADGGTETIQSGGVASGTLIASGGTAVVSSGGVLVISGAGDGGVIQLLSGGTLDIEGTVMPVGEIAGFTEGSVIDLEADPYGSLTGFTETQDSVTFTTDAGTSETLRIVGVGGQNGELLKAADGSTLFETTCFAAGTLIGTPDGERAVEEIRAGELVDTAEGPRAVVWCGHRTVEVARLAEPDEHWLVRIRAGAFGDAAPWRDLWVTGEHGILVDGGLVPARMLVNGGSIVRDRTRGRYTYHHLELERHGILFAEGLPTESYLDTGNRGAFANAGMPALRPGLAVEAEHRRWATDAAAPLVTDRERVELIWRRLVERARARGWMHGADAAAARNAARTTDPALRLELAGGGELATVAWDGMRAVFRVPAGERVLRLRSRRARPSDAVGAFVDDRRRLGVAVTAVTLRRDGGADAVALDAAMLGGAGWHALEGRSRWTNGAAELALPVADAPVVVEVEVAGTMSYAAEGAAGVEAEAA